MKKLTTIALAVLFLLSIIIVGIFGMKSVPYNEIIYTKELVFNNVYAAHSVMEIGDVTVKKNKPDDLDDTGYYAVIRVDALELISEKNPLTVMVDYQILPADATQKEVDITVVDGADHVVIDNGRMTVTKAVNFRLSYRRLDSTGSKVMYLQVRFRTK